MMLGTDKKFEESKLASEANLIAAINITRNTFDILAQLVNSLAVPQPLAIERCDIIKVREALLASNLKAEITRVTQLAWYRYLTGFSNTIKHRQLILHTPSSKHEEETGKYLGGAAEIAPFDYRNEKFKSYWVQEVLEGTVEMHNEIVSLGISLNEWCFTPA